MTFKEIIDRVKKAQSVEYTDEEFDSLMGSEDEKEEVDTRIVVPPSVYKELKKQKYDMRRYIKSKLIKINK